MQLNHDPTQQFISSVLSEKVISHIILLTRLSDHSGMLIDHILVKHNKNTQYEEIVSGSLYLPNFICVQEGQINKPDRPLVIIYGDKILKGFKKM